MESRAERGRLEPPAAFQTEDSDSNNEETEVKKRHAKEIGEIIKNKSRLLEIHPSI